MTDDDIIDLRDYPTERDVIRWLRDLDARTLRDRECRAACVRMIEDKVEVEA